METKKISMGEKTFEVHELLATESDEVQDIENPTKRIIAIVKKSTNMSDEDYAQLTIKERSKIMDVMSELNGWDKSDFQDATTEKKD